MKALLTTAALAVSSCVMIHADSNHMKAGAVDTSSNQFWWPDQLNLAPLRAHGASSNPMDRGYDYRKEFAKLDLAQVKKDIQVVLKDSQDWWPADYGHYGPFFIRMAWHSAGTYRVTDGRGGAGGGQQRFDPLNSWPDNGNLDKARRLLWPVKKKYGKSLSWADLMILAGNVALEDMGFKTFGFAGGRTDDWEADLVYWGPETKMLGRKRHGKDGKLQKPFGATHMGLIYVNPEGPNGDPDPLKAAKAIREAFGRMAMNDEETVALIAGGHTFGKAHGAHKVEECVGVEPGAAGIEAQGFGWKNKCGEGKGIDTVTSGLEGAWTPTPTLWTTAFFETLFAFEWELTRSPAGAKQWKPKNPAAANLVPDAHHKTKRHAPMMLTTDLALRMDPAYKEISLRFKNNHKEFEDAFARAWFKLTHRDMGPAARYVGSEVPKETLIWQDPVPEVDYELVNNTDVDQLKDQIASSGLSATLLVKAAWASASTFRGSDMRGGANGARVRLTPQKDWAVNDPEELSSTIATLEGIAQKFNRNLKGNKKISLADTIVLGGAVGIEMAAKAAGYTLIRVPFKPGRTDATQAQTDVESFSYLEPKADAFRNYYSKESYFSPTKMLVDKAALLGLTVPEMTVLLGGMRVMNANTGGSTHGVLTNTPGQLDPSFFENLLDMSIEWKKSSKSEGIYEGHDRKSGELKWTATPVDLVVGSHAELRAIAELYAADDGRYKFLRDFVDAWTKVMQADRFDLN